MFWGKRNGWRKSDWCMNRGPQMTPVLIGKEFVSEGWNPTIEDIHRFQEDIAKKNNKNWLEWCILCHAIWTHCVPLFSQSGPLRQFFLRGFYTRVRECGIFPALWAPFFWKTFSFFELACSNSGFFTTWITTRLIQGCIWLVGGQIVAWTGFHGGWIPGASPKCVWDTDTFTHHCCSFFLVTQLDSKFFQIPLTISADIKIYFRVKGLQFWVCLW